MPFWNGSRKYWVPTVHVAGALEEREERGASHSARSAAVTRGSSGRAARRSWRSLMDGAARALVEEREEPRQIAGATEAGDVEPALVALLAALAGDGR